jgi:DNA-binding SARP family transcriptional activator
LFWPDRALAQGCGSLRTELWRIRAAFNKQCMPAALVFAESGHSVQFSCQAALSIDFETFDALLADTREGTRMDNLRAAAAMYKGDLLAGIDDTWCTYHRELYRSRYLSAIEEMIDRESRASRCLQAVDLCIRFLIEDPFAEHIHCKLMNSYRQMGNRVAAMRQFQLYRERLEQAFEIAPMPETVALFDAIVREHAAAVRGGERRLPGPASKARVRISQALSRIRRDIEHATDAFEYSIAQLDVRANDKKPPTQKSNTTSTS